MIERVPHVVLSAVLVAAAAASLPGTRVTVASATTGEAAHDLVAARVGVHRAVDEEPAAACSSPPLWERGVDVVEEGGAVVATFPRVGDGFVACVGSPGHVPVGVRIPAPRRGLVELRVALEPAVVVTGRVVAAEDDAALTAFAIQVLRLVEQGATAEGAGTGRMSTTSPRHQLHRRVEVESADGTFRIGELPRGGWSLRVEAPDRLARMVGPFEPVPGVPHDLGDIPLRLGASVFGRVIDAQSGEPIENATVTSAEAEATATTDARGEFTLRPLPEGPQTLRARHEARPSIEGVASASVRADIRPEDRPVTIELDAPGTVVVDVQDVHGAAVPGLEVFVQPREPTAAPLLALTDEDGLAVLRPVRPGRVEAGAMDRDVRVEGEVTAGETLHVPITLEGDVTVHGPIRREGRPVACVVSLIPWFEHPVAYGLDDAARAASSFEVIGVSPGPLALHVREVVERPGRSDFLRTHVEHLVVPGGVSSVHHAIDLPSVDEDERDGPLEVEGRLLHLDTREPLAGWLVRDSRTGEDGAFVVRLPGDGVHELRASANRLRSFADMGLEARPATPVVVVDGRVVEPPPPVEVLARPGPRVRVRILDAHGAPVAGAHVGFDTPLPVKGLISVRALSATDAAGLAWLHARGEGPARLFVHHEDRALLHVSVLDAREGAEHAVRLPPTGTLRVAAMGPIGLVPGPDAPVVSLTGSNWPGQVRREGDELVVSALGAGPVQVHRGERVDEVVVLAGGVVALGP